MTNSVLPAAGWGKVVTTACDGPAAEGTIDQSRPRLQVARICEDILGVFNDQLDTGQSDLLAQLELILADPVENLQAVGDAVQGAVDRKLHGSRPGYLVVKQRLHGDYGVVYNELFLTHQGIGYIRVFGQVGSGARRCLYCY